MLKKLLIIFFLITLFVSFQGTILAHEEGESTSSSKIESTSYEEINPKDGFKFSFKRLQEKIMLVLFSFSAQSKLDFQKDLLSKRLAELKYVVDNKDISNLQTTSQRYYSQAGQLTEFVLKNNLDKHGLKDQLSSHLLVLEVLKKQYNDTTAEWRFLEHDVDYIKAYIKQLN